MQQIRVVTAELPPILSEIIGTVLDSAGDIQVVGEAVNRAELLELTRRVRPDIVIIGLDESGVLGFAWDLYAADPLLRVLGVVGEGRQTAVYELRPHRTPLGELSPEELVVAVRRMADARSAACIDGGIMA